MEQEGEVTSSEYHKCMSEVYFTKALMWMMWTGFVLKVAQQNETKNILLVMSGVMSVVYFALSYQEFRETNHG